MTARNFTPAARSWEEPAVGREERRALNMQRDGRADSVSALAHQLPFRSASVRGRSVKDGKKLNIKRSSSQESKG